MRQKQILAIALFILVCCFGCKKDDTSADLATGTAGYYTGTWTLVGTGTIPGTCQVVKVSNSSVNLIMTANGGTVPPLPGVKLSNGGNGKVNLSYSDNSGTLNGSMQNNTLTFTITDGTVVEIFAGTR
jgi:hypothetical protein